MKVGKVGMARFAIGAQPPRRGIAASVAAAAAAVSALGACYYLLVQPPGSTATSLHAISFPKVPLRPTLAC